MLKIRLQRAGRRNLPHFRVVVASHSAPVKGKFVAKLGSYNPLTKEISLSKEAILSWLNKGAKPSNTVSRLLIGQGLKHKLVKYKKRPKREPKAKHAPSADSAQLDQTNNQNNRHPLPEAAGDKES